MSSSALAVNYRSWLIYAALMIVSIIASSRGHDINGANDRSSDGDDLPGEVNPSAASSASSSKDSKSSFRRIETTENEIALCSATLMAVETREKMLKEQLLECHSSAIECSNNDKVKVESLDYAQRLQQMEREIIQEREQMRRTLSHYTRTMNRRHEELMLTNDQLLQQNANFRRQIIRYQDELFTLRYEYHRFNESQRQKQIFFHRWRELLLIYGWKPVLNWLRDPLWDRIVLPHVISPLKKSASQCFIVAREYFGLYLPILHRHSMATWNSVSQDFVEPTSHSIHLFLRKNPYLIRTWIFMEELLGKCREWVQIIVLPALIPFVQRFQIQLLWATEALADVLFILGSSLEQWLCGKFGLGHGLGFYTDLLNAASYLVRFAASLLDRHGFWFLPITVLFLFYLIRKRRRRYIE